MGLVKRQLAVVPDIPPTDAKTDEETLESQIGALSSSDPASRRRAAIALSAYPAAAPALCEQLACDGDPAVRSAIITSLIENRSGTVAELLAPLLRSEDTALRNAVAEALAQMPNESAPIIEDLLNDPESDTRIAAITILGSLNTQTVVPWLHDVLRDDDHVNVCAAAIDCLSEIGNEETIPLLEKLAKRFAGEPFITFAVAAAIRRIKGE